LTNTGVNWHTSRNREEKVVDREKRSRFVRLAENRVSRAMNSIRLIGNLSNKSNYSYTDADVRAIISALQAEINNLKGQFNRRDSKSSDQFRLPK
jgi:hypothetical protein